MKNARVPAVLRGSRRMTELPDVCAELANLGVPAVGCERPGHADLEEAGPAVSSVDID
jgi:hypothetical protein